LVMFAHRFVVTVFRVLMFCLWKKKVDGCWVEGAAALGCSPELMLWQGLGR